MISFEKIIGNDSDLQEVVRKSGTFIFLRVLGLILGYVFTVLISREFGAQVYGHITLGFSVLMIFSVLGKCGWDITLTRLTASENYSKSDLHGHIYKVLAWSMLISSLLTIFLISQCGFVARQIFNDPKLEAYIFWAGLTIPLWSATLILSAFFRGLRKNVLFAILNSPGRFFFSLILLAVFSCMGFSGELLPMKAHFAAIAFMFLVAFFILSGLGYFPKIVSTRIDFKEFVKQSNPILFSSMVFILLTWSDRIILGIYRPATDVGTYDVVFRLGLLIGLNLEAINSILAPKISQFYYGAKFKELQRLISISTAGSSLIATISFIFVLVFGDVVLAFIGKEYTETVDLLAIIGCGQLINCFLGSTGTILDMTGHQKDHLTILVLGLAINLVLGLILVKPYGTYGVAIATVCSVLAWNVAGAILVHRRLNLISYLTNPLKSHLKS